LSFQLTARQESILLGVSIVPRSPAAAKPTYKPACSCCKICCAEWLADPLQSSALVANRVNETLDPIDTAKRIGGFSQKALYDDKIEIVPNSLLRFCGTQKDSL
jgi:hypothetical protein